MVAAVPLGCQALLGSDSCCGVGSPGFTGAGALEGFVAAYQAV